MIENMLSLYPIGKVTSFLPIDIDYLKDTILSDPYRYDYSEHRLKFTPPEEQQRYYEFADTHCPPEHWPDLLRPQNRHPQIMLAELDEPGWTALIECEEYYDNGNMNWLYARYPQFFRAYHNPEPTNTSIKIAAIQIIYRLPVTTPRGNPNDLKEGASLYVGAQVLDNPFGWQDSDQLWLQRQPITDLWISAHELAGFHGFTQPIDWQQIVQEPNKLQDFTWFDNYDIRGKSFNVAPITHSCGDETKPDPAKFDDTFSVLPFELRNGGRVCDAFSTQKVNDWLERTHGIRWLDPTFYTGRVVAFQAAYQHYGYIPDTHTRMTFDQFRFTRGMNVQKYVHLSNKGLF